MSEFIKLEINKKTYLLGFPNRASIREAEKRGLKVQDYENTLSFADTLFYTSLLAKQPEITREEADKLIDELVEEDNYNYQDVVTELGKLYMGFYGNPEKAEKKHKKIEIVSE